MPVTLRFQSTGAIPGSGEQVQMHGESLTIGRGDENDLVLPDPDRMLSKRHCAIEDHNGNVIVVDFSTNGTFLNYGKLALGATPTPLNDGDILSIGPYEVVVNILSDQAIERLADPLMEDPVSHGLASNAPSTADLLDAPGDGGDFLDDLLDGRDGLVGPGSVDREDLGDDGLLPPLGDDDLLPPTEDPFAGQGASTGMHAPSAQDHFAAPRTTGGVSAIPDDWDEDFLAPTPPSAPMSIPAAPIGTPQNPFAETSDTVQSAVVPENFDLGDPAIPEPANTPPQPSAEPTRLEMAEPEHAAAAAAPAAIENAPSPVESPVAMAAASGANDEAARAFLKSLGAEDVELKDQELTSTLSRMGHVLRIMIEGVREILMTRTSIKSEFRIDQTMIQAGGNNPLKFSISPEQAVEAMVKPKAKGYLDATEATTQALQDVKAHEVAMITGMEAALKGVLSRLDPKVLEDKIVVKGAFSSLIKSKKARYWEVYEDMYAEISDQAENDFHELFAKEFAKAYQDQLNKLK